jgi:hypothetical protein
MVYFIQCGIVYGSGYGEKIGDAGKFSGSTDTAQRVLQGAGNPMGHSL